MDRQQIGFQLLVDVTTLDLNEGVDGGEIFIATGPCGFDRLGLLAEGYFCGASSLKTSPRSGVRHVVCAAWRRGRRFVALLPYSSLSLHRYSAWSPRCLCHFDTFRRRTAIGIFEAWARLPAAMRGQAGGAGGVGPAAVLGQEAGAAAAPPGADGVADGGTCESREELKKRL